MEIQECAKHFISNVGHSLNMQGCIALEQCDQAELEDNSCSLYTPPVVQFIQVSDSSTSVLD